ncbi:SRPBCC family protein [Blastopirellula marina]|uniref:Transcriptional regulator n=1 Tax=Blastopirellula marina TaxID=124 RepID=A0A2S8F4B5_9BACT|nr:SRPBCC family protein [Blastopirellula marina]PQO26998.1 transcriptional regulator [Blastopirellula marina]PTL41145.1 transcriptional regulator [Blastopirellula marina]
MPRFHVEKSIEIAAPPEKVYETVVDYATWSRWSPWLCSEPDAVVTVSENSNAIGSLYSWEGKIVGAGEIEHVQLEPGRSIVDEIRFTKPHRSSSSVRFDFERTQSGTLLTWQMDGSLPWFLFWMTSMMQTFIGMDYERGLKMLKEYIETGKVPSQTKVVGIEQVEPLKMVGLRRSCTLSGIGPSMEAAVSELLPLLEKQGLAQEGELMSAYHKFNLKSQTCDYTIGKVLAADTDVKVDAPLVVWSSPATKALCVEHLGDYRHLGNGWSAANQYVRYKRLKQSGCSAFEIYTNDPHHLPVEQWCTKIYLPLK